VANLFSQCGICMAEISGVGTLNNLISQKHIEHKGRQRTMDFVHSNSEWPYDLHEVSVQLSGRVLSNEGRPPKIARLPDCL